MVIPAVIGSVVGVLAVVAAATVFVVLLRRRRTQKQREFNQAQFDLKPMPEGGTPYGMTPLRISENTENTPNNKLNSNTADYVNISTSNGSINNNNNNNSNGISHGYQTHDNNNAIVNEADPKKGRSKLVKLL